MNNIAFYLNPDGPEIPKDILSKTRLVEIPDDKDVGQHIESIKKIHPEIIVAVQGQFE